MFNGCKAADSPLKAIASNRHMLVLGLVSSFSVIQLAGVSVFLLLLYLYLFLQIITGKARIEISSPFLLYLFTALISTFMPFLFGLPNGYIANDVKGIINLCAIFVFASTVIRSGNAGERVSAFLIGLKWSCRVQACWIVLQFVLWTWMSIDINEQIFVSLLGLVDKASQYKGTGYVPTGLCWNAGGIAPILFIGFFLEKKRAAKLTVACVALLTQSATLTLGIALCLIFDLFGRRELHSGLNCLKLNKGAILLTLVALPAIIVLIIINTEVILGIVGRLWEVFSYRLAGLLSEGSTMDSSTSAHLGYLINIPQLLMSSSLFNLMFGYGNNCSGFHYSNVTGQYAGETWIVECDPTNILLNNGVIGFVAYYFWIASGLHALRRFRPLFLSVLVLMLMGLTYNLQYVWVVLFELLVFEIASISDCSEVSKNILIGER